MTARDLPFPAAPKLAKDFHGIEDRLPYELVEHFPHVLMKIEALWPQPAVTSYLDGLLFADRPDRVGFTDAALAEAFFIKQLHDFLYPPDPAHMQATATTIVADRLKPTNVQELAQWYPPPVASPRLGGAPQPDEPSAPPGQVSLFDDPHPASLWRQVDSNDALRQLLQRREPGVPLATPLKGRLGELLRERGLLRPEQVERALQMQSQAGGGPRPLFGQVLLRLALLPEDELIRALCAQEGVPLVDLDRLEISADARSRLPCELARQHRAVPVLRVGKLLAVAVENPLTFPAKDFLSFYTDLSVELVCAARAAISWRLEHYEAGSSPAQLDQEFKAIARHALRQTPLSNHRHVAAAAPAPPRPEEDATIIDLVNKMVNDALAQKASDIHLEARGDAETSLIRFRRDGRLERYSEFPGGYHDAVIARLKIMADLDIAEKRKPQDGKIDFSRFTGRKLDIRLATIPTVHGVENASLRLLSASEPLPLERIGLAPRDLGALTQVIERPHGLLLVCGPTGSGKTTTLHSILARLNTGDRKIWTAEDPVEIAQKGLSQVQVHPKIGLTFAHALRAFLRADPDVIMIGEMRDEETARTAIEASMTGHLVLSTLHTNSSAETATRLLELGIDPFGLSDALLCIVSQRLARRLCPHCRTPSEPKPEELSELAGEFHYAAHHRFPARAERDRIVGQWQADYGNGASLKLYKATGCGQCKDTGYAGRLGIYEVLVADEKVRHAVRERAPASAIRTEALGTGMLTLKQDGMLKVLQGMTDLHEVRAACI